LVKWEVVSRAKPNEPNHLEWVQFIVGTTTDFSKKKKVLNAGRTHRLVRVWPGQAGDDADGFTNSPRSSS
jgi:hypothetical protein